MNIVETIVTPIITGIFIGGFVLWILYMIFKVIRKTMPNFKFTMKYKVFRKKWDEQVVMWCMEAISKDMTLINTEKFLLMKGVNPKRTTEMMYIYDQVLNNMKGGINIKNEQLRQSNEQTKLPKIKES